MRPFRKGGSGLAIAGIILGWIGVAIVLVGVLAAVTLLAASSGSSGTPSSVISP